MPTYEYRCRDCGHELEAYQSFSEAALTECPSCSGSLRKLFGNVGISFKGTGIYKNDHGSRAQGSGTETKSDTKTDSGSSTSSTSTTSSSESSSSSSSSSSDSKPASGTTATSSS